MGIMNAELDVNLVRDKLLDEIYYALGARNNAWKQRFLKPFLWLPGSRFAKISAAFELDTAHHGFCEASRRHIWRFVEEIEVRGAGNIPLEGPLLIASNHPGTFDGFIIASQLPRRDLKIIVRKMPFVHQLPATHQHIIDASLDGDVRVAAVRSVIKQLRDSGVLLIMPSGTVDPDPAVMPGIEKYINTWSPSLAYVLKKVPQTKILVTIVSGVMSPTYINHPLTRLRGGGKWEKQIMAEMLQVIRQLFFPGKITLHPKVSFTPAVTYEELLHEEKLNDIQGAIIQRAQRTLIEHMQHYYPVLQEWLDKSQMPVLQRS